MKSERPKPSPESEEILRLKDNILYQGEQLPVEHQASMAMVLIDGVIAGEWGRWLKETINPEWPTKHEDSGKVFTITGISREDLERLHLGGEVIAQLDDADLRRIAQQIEDHLINDVFWDELEYAVLDIMAQKVLSEKRVDSQDNVP